MLTLDVDPRSPERGQYGFVQGLIREVAYGTLARRDRRRLHLAAARYFETLDDEGIAGALAEHYVAAYRAQPEGPEGDAVAAQARVALRGAAERARSLGSFRQAVRFLERALEVTTDPGEQRRCARPPAEPAEMAGPARRADRAHGPRAGARARRRRPASDHGRDVEAAQAHANQGTMVEAAGAARGRARASTRDLEGQRRVRPPAGRAGPREAPPR